MKSWISFDFLYERFGISKAYREFHEEFVITSVGWIYQRVFAFIVYFLGLLIFPRHEEKIHTILDMVAKIMTEGIEGQTYTIIPII